MKRGRKSAAELSVIVDASRRLPPPVPADLTDAQGAVWRDTVGSLPGNWMTEAAHPIMVAYCRHVCRARLLEMQIVQFEIEWTSVDGGLERLDRMLAMAERETRAMTACARALRLTPQSRVQPITAGRAFRDMPSSRPMPWE